MQRWLTLCGVLVMSSLAPAAQDSSGYVQQYQLSQASAAIALGFNYDLLKPPTAVSYDNARGYFGINIPFKTTVNPLKAAGGSIDSMFADTTVFRDGRQFQPTASAEQNANTTVRVDVPMMGGVATFSYIQNFYLGYNTVLGTPAWYSVRAALPTRSCSSCGGT